MPTREIARDEWPEFLDAFSRQHDLWIVSVEVAGADIGAQVEGQRLRLRGISADAGQSSISIMLETPGGGHLTHTVIEPSHLWIEQTSTGAEAALQIQSGDGDTTLVRFRSAMRPEEVDGMPEHHHA
jgi:methyl coenzyme M reductase subunit C